MHARRVTALIPERRIREIRIRTWTAGPEAIGAPVAANCYPHMKPHQAKCEDFCVAGAEIRAAAGVGTDIEEEKRRRQIKKHAQLVLHLV
jgi:hypothetical protein